MRTVVFLFDTLAGSSNKGKILVTMTNGAVVGTPWEFYIEITAPSGQVIKAAALDATLSVGQSSSFVVNIPLDSNGNYLQGEYTFSVRRKNNVSDTTEIKTYEYVSHNSPDHLCGTPVLATSLSCLTGLILAEDTTDYDGYGITVDDREFIITPPSIDPQAAVEDDATSVQMTVAYTNVTYEVTLEVEMTWGAEDLGDAISASAQGSVLYYKEIKVECEDAGICGSLTCLSEYLDKLNAEACAAGGFTRLPQPFKDKLSWMTANLVMAKFLYDCGNVNASKAYLDIAKDGVNCGCGCSGTPTDAKPKPYTAPAA